MYATDLTAIRAVASRRQPAAPSRGLPRVARWLRTAADRLDPSAGVPQVALAGRGIERPC